TDVQNNMNEYLNTKTSDSLENYYRSEQYYTILIEDLTVNVSNRSFDRMERNIKYMSEEYLDIVNQAIEAKRGRNVEKYRVHNENATILYEYIQTNIYSLNNEQFISNTENYIEISNSFQLLETVSLFVLFIVILGNVLMIILLVGTLIRPLKELSKKADEVANGNFDIEPLEIIAEDEIGVVTKAFNQMIISIREYIEQLRLSMEKERNLKEKELLMETHLKDAQLKYLQAQIDPHFLFNTLNAGVQLAMMEGADKTSEYVRHLAEFFRYNIKKRPDVVTLKEELELIDNYIYILNVRFSGEIHFIKEIDSSLIDIKIPSMILQPIMENCIQHGIRSMKGNGEIVLSVFKENNNVCISIKDNGIGMDESVISNILKGDYVGEKEHSNGVGMDNVIKRIQLFTESNEAIAITSEGEGKGTTVNIFLHI
ncbi:MAG: sensor histidine kinase, partial [Lachnospiraceae bacterium]